MPAHIALEHLDDIVATVIDSQAAVGPHVAQRRQVKLEFAIPFREGDLFGVGQMLIWEHQQRILQPGFVEQLEGWLIEPRER